MSDTWLEQLKQLREADKAKHQDSTGDLDLNGSNKRATAADLLRQSKAHELLRQVQKSLLAGQGTLDIFDRAGAYERAIALVWQGPISAARRPQPNDPAPYYYILIGVRQGKLWVNDRRVAKVDSEALKKALLKACKKPAREK